MKNPGSKKTAVVYKSSPLPWCWRGMRATVRVALDEHIEIRLKVLPYDAKRTPEASMPYASAECQRLARVPAN